jgi:hypothetical protein
VAVELSLGTPAAAIAPGPFVSVIDSVDFRVSAGGESKGHVGRRLSRYKTIDSVSFTVPEGSVTFDVQVFSSLGMVLYTGSQTSNVSGTTTRVTVPLTASRPVLVVAPDTIRSSGPQTASFVVYNAGASSMSWSLSGTSPLIASCAGACTHSTIVPVPALQTNSFAVTVPPPFASAVVYYDLSTPEGTVRVVWDYTAPVVSSVVVTPTASLVSVGGTTTLGAQVNSNGGSTAVTWTPTSAAIATISASGFVTGVSTGSTMMTAASQVNPTRRDSALVRVHTPFVGSWSISAPAATDTVHRDGPAGSLTKLLSAVTSGPTAVYVNPFSNAEFWGRPIGGTTWVRLGASPAAAVTDNGVTRTYTYNLTWNPDVSTASFANPSSTRLEVIAVGITAAGAVRSAPLNTNLWVVVP